MPELGVDALEVFEGFFELGLIVEVLAEEEGHLVAELIGDAIGVEVGVAGDALEDLGLGGELTGEEEEPFFFYVYSDGRLAPELYRRYAAPFLGPLYYS